MISSSLIATYKSEVRGEEVNVPSDVSVPVMAIPPVPVFM
jgi:hypothetical protein